MRKPSEEQGFRDFISDEGLGAEQNKIFQENKQELALKKQALVKVSQEVNAIKRKIDIASESVNDKRNARTSQPQLQESKEGVEVIDEEEYALIKQLKDLKRQYQATFQERKGIQSEVAYLKNLTEKSKVVLCNSFLEWFAETYGPEDEMQEQDGLSQTLSLLCLLFLCVLFFRAHRLFGRRGTVPATRAHESTGGGP